MAMLAPEQQQSAVQNMNGLKRAFDAKEVRARSRFRAAVIEEKGMLPIYLI